jgi:hypothetical protein
MLARRLHYKLVTNPVVMRAEWTLKVDAPHTEWVCVPRLNAPVGQSGAASCSSTLSAPKTSLSYSSSLGFTRTIHPKGPLLVDSCVHHPSKPTSSSTGAARSRDNKATGRRSNPDFILYNWNQARHAKGRLSRFFASPPRRPGETTTRLGSCEHGRSARHPLNTSQSIEGGTGHLKPLRKTQIKGA